jgi:4-aminobutyrate aminotransferase / (S)-3-amino-2-methylpropionate transaminase / 5-aminovalerate transaminase
VACAAAIAVFDRIEHDGLLTEASRIEGVLKPALLALQKKYPIIAEVRGIGAMLAVELNDPTTGAPQADVPGKVAAFAAQQGVLVLTAGTYGNVLRFLPSLAISDAQLADAVEVLDAAFAAL